ncbi:MAG: hypothetical protein ACR2J8_10335 [Thermomicrobiales bacterium]
MEPFILGAPVVALVPGLVEAMKRAGMASRWAGLAAIGWAAALVALADLSGANITGYAGGGGLVTPGRVAGWALAGVVYGLAAAGLYSQAREATRRAA